MAYPAEWDAWLDRLAADRLGGKSATLPGITRGIGYAIQITFPGNLTGWTLSAGVAVAPGAAPVASFTPTIGTFDSEGNQTPVTFTMSSTAVATLPADGDGDGVTWLLYDILGFPSGGGYRRLRGGVVPVLARIANVS